MKKLLTLLAVATIAANLTGCCCLRLCPWLDRGDYCGPAAPTFAPLAAAVPAPQYQYAAPLAAQSPCCTTWDPCRGTAVSYGYSDPGCCYAEPACGQPSMGGMGYMGYGPIMSGDCTTCAPGVGGTVIGPSPVLPGPAQ
jgi:hypothetical protein